MVLIFSLQMHCFPQLFFNCFVFNRFQMKEVQTCTVFLLNYIFNNLIFTESVLFLGCNEPWQLLHNIYPPYIYASCSEAHRQILRHFYLPHCQLPRKTQYLRVSGLPESSEGKGGHM